MIPSSASPVQPASATPQDDASHALTLAQQAVWLDQVSHPHAPLYNIGMTFEIDGPIEPAVLERAMNEVANANDALRLVLSEGGADGLARQRVLPAVDTRIAFVDFSGQPDAEARALAYLNETFRQPFTDLGALLWDTHLVRSAPNRYHWLHRYHHLVTDGLGVAVISHEVSLAYTRLLADPAATVERGPSYLGQVEDDRAYLQSPRHEKDRRFWRERFESLPPSLLPRAAALGQASPSHQSRWMLGRDLFNRLAAFAGEHGASITHVFMAVLAVYFSRVNRHEQVVIGLPVHNRSSAQLRRTVGGMFSSVSPIGIQVDPERSLLELMSAISAELRLAYRHQRFPIAELNRGLNLAQQGRRQLFDVRLSIETLEGDHRFGGTLAKVRVMDNGHEQTPLSIFVRDYHPNADVPVEFNFNGDGFRPEEIERIRAGVERLLGMAIEQAHTRVSRLPLLDEAERHRLLVGLNDSAADYPRDRLVHQLFEDQVASRRHAIALEFEGETLSYDQLNRRANQLAHRLVALGAKPDDRVAICMERSLEMVVGLLAIMKAGAAYVPIDPSYPAERLAYLLADSAPIALLTQARLAPALPAGTLPTLVLDELATAASLARESGENPDPAALGLRPDHLAYVIYTSGSTGQPKGAMNEHLGVVNRLCWARDEYALGAEDRVLQKTPFGFDVSVWEFFLPLLAGARLVLARPDGHRDPRYLAELIEQRGITMLHFVPSMLQLFVDELGAGRCPTLRHLLCSGEALPYTLQQRTLALLPQARLSNLYGPTEAAIDVSFWHCRADAHPGIVPIGRPVANTQIYLLDELGQPVPMGAIGELYLGGVQVARGYLNRPELSAERFVRDPFRDEAGARLYRTGDLGRYLADGSIEYLGRTDFQVKIRGLRVELGEIETRLAASEGVREAVVIARDDGEGARLVAYLVALEGASLVPAALREALAAALPDYMVPNAFVVMEAFPLSPNGKLERRALPAPDADAVVARAYQAPRGDTEVALAAIWQELLGLERVGRHDSFFDLGGHSLLAVQLVSRLRKAFGAELPLRELFARPVLAELAARIEADSEAGAAPAAELPPILPRARDSRLPLSFAQQRLWFLDTLDQAAGAAYHMPAALRLSGQLDPAALRAALDRIVARHEVLRTTIDTVDGQPVQRIAEAGAGFALDTQDLRGLADEACQAAVTRIAGAEALAPFDLARGPLIRGQLLALDDTQHILLVTQHHIVSDGWSIGVLIDEISTLYAAFHRRQPDPLPPLAIQYADYAAWQRDWLQGETLQRQTGFWRDHLAGAPALLELPTDRPRPAMQSYAGGRIAVAFPRELGDALRQLGRQHGTTLFMTLFAGWAALLSRLTHQRDLVIGTPVANRQQAELEPLIGFFVNTLALRVRLEDNPDVAGLLQQVRQTALDAYAHQDLPFEQVVEAVQPPRSLSHSPIFQAMISLNNTPAHALELPGLQLETLAQAHVTTQFDLSLSLVDEDGIISGDLEYASDLFDASTVERLIANLQTLLAGMAADPSRRLGTLPLLDETQRQQVLVDFNRSEAPWPAQRTVHQLFEAVVASRPEAIAVAHGQHALSYDALNRRANRIAHALIEIGVRPDQRVAISAERGIDTVAGLLGILKAGAAYVPLDPAYPPARIEHMLRDSAPVALLTQAALADKLPALDAPTLLLDDEAHFARFPEQDPVTEVAPGNLVYVIYTSGSTGLPKGVMVEHRNLVNYTVDAIRLFAITPEDVVLQQNSLNFDLSAEEIFPALLGGATLMPATQIFGYGEPGETEAARKPSFVHLTAAHWHTLVAEWDRRPERARELLASVRLVNVTGDALSTQKLELWDRFRPEHTRLVNTYGPTETTVSCTAAYVGFDEARQRGMGIATIGKPLANTRIYLLDEHLQPVPQGVSGELHIGGDGVTRGYLNRDELTAQRFIRDPFSQRPGERLYKTGDLARWLPDGSLEYLGRNDFQVKIRGFRIELGEVEARLAECEGVGEAVVVARREEDGSRQLVAYVVPQSGAELGAKRTEKRAVTRLRNRLASTLADFMVPRAFVVLKSLPLTPNGKLDRNALPAPDESAILTRVFEAPRGHAELVLSQIWQALLGVEQVGRNDNFFEVGGHSLLAITLIERLRQKDLKIDVKTVFAAPVLSEMALKIGAVAPQAAPAVAPNRIPEGCTAITPAMLPLVELGQAEIDLLAAEVPGGAAAIQDIYPLSSLQDGILFHHLLDTEGDAYLMRTVLAFDTRGRLDAFLAALQTVISRHDVLRSSVHWNGLRQPVQVVHRQAALVVETPALDAGRDTLGQLLALTDPARVRLDLSRAPLSRAWIAPDPRSGEWLLSLLDHHMVSDHVTLELMLEEIRTIMDGRAAQLRASTPYRNFIAQSRAVEPGVHERYFRQQLGDIETPTALFGLFDTQGDGADIHEASLALPAELAQRIRDCAQRQGVTGAVLFHAAWALVLSACTGQDDVVFGTVLSGRLQGTEGADQTFGMFLNTLPVRASFGGRSAADLTEQMRLKLSGLLDHEQASLASAQRCSAVPASVPLFSTLLNYRHSPETARTQHGTADVFLGDGVRVLAADERTNYPFDMTVDDLGAGFALTLRCLDQVDPKPLLHYLATAIESLVDALGEASPRPAARLAILPATEQRRLVAAAGSGDAASAAAGTRPAEPVHRRFEAQAAARPDAPALDDGRTRLSYGELERRANALAHRLIGAGVVPDTRVALHLERGIDLMIGLLATLKAGAAYVPIDPSYPAERIAYMIADCAPAAILTHVDALPEALRDSGAPCLDPREVAVPGDDPGVPAVTAAPGDLAYLIYTSGSTGEPKGVMVEHRGLSNLMDWYLEDVGVGRDDAVLIVTSPSFDLTQKNLLAPLMTGGILHLAEPRFDPPAILARIRRDGIGHLNLSPSAFHALIDADGGHDLSRLRRVVLGGEPIQAARLAAIPAPRPVFVNSYGPTECSDVAGWHVLSTELDDYRDAPVPLGRPIRHARLYLLDAHDRLVPPGVTGEICIGGAGVARGYLNRPELSAERFVRDPFGDEADARLYRTGDLGRYLPDGNIEYLGRNDFQVKIRGLRVELGEIEAALAACEGVGEAVVIARQDGASESARLVAYLVPLEGAAPAPAELRARLATSLPDYMVPNAFVALAAFPLTPNGKLDRRALPAPDAAAVVMQAYSAPQGETEPRLAAIWQELLGLERVGRHDNFLELGGHSLLAVQLASRLRKAFGVELPLRELLARPVLAELAARIEAGAEAGAAPAAELPPILPRARDGRLPLSFAQQRLWFLDTLDQAAGAAYHMPAALRLSGRLDPAALRAALDRIVARHEVLRASIAVEQGEPFLRIGEADQGFRLAVHDLRGIAAEARELAVARIGEAEAIEPFDLAQGPLIRGQLLELDDEDHLLLVTQHHIVSDGWSIGVLIDEISALYAAFHQRQPDPLPPLAIQYADYAAWQRERLQGEALARQAGFWKARLADAPALLELPTDRPRPAVQSYRGASVPLAFPRELGDALRQLGRQHGTTLFMTLFAGWAALLSRLAHQRDLVIGTPVANRQQAELEPLIGFFVNTLALRVRLEDNPDVATLLQRVKADALAAYAHQELPFEQVVEAVQPPRSLSHSPIFQAMISLDNTPARTLDLPGLKLAPLAQSYLSTQFDLSLSLVDRDGIISGELEYASDLFDASTVARLAAHLQTLLAGMAADTGCRVGALPLLDETQRQQVLVDFNATGTDYPADLTIHALFEKQVRATPEAIAVLHGEHAISYDALNRQANRIAHALIETGVGTDQCVALCAERGIGMVAGLLGILKAGAAYVPLDPAYPPARIEHMLRDSAPVALLTQAALADKLPALDAPTLLLDDEAHFARFPEQDPVTEVAPGNLVYVIYTSGSTGLPKGVMVEHRNLVNYTVDAIRLFAITPEDVVLQQNSLNFDLSAEEIFPALLAGATLMPATQIFGAGASGSRPPSVVHLTAAHWHTLVAEWDRQPAKARELLASVRLVNVTGDALSTQKLELWDRFRPEHTRLVNTYGPTETTVSCTAAYVGFDEARQRGMGIATIGKPLANTRIYLLDEHLQPVPQGVSGELHIGGDGVTRGYLNRDELTAQRFIRDPFSQRPGERLYKTGDLARWLPDGSLEYLGRNDFQVKIRGFRIELGEVEARLAECEGVREAAVIALTEADGAKRLVAYVVPQDGAQPGVADLQTELGAQLAAHMIPSAFVLLDAFPLTPNGKLDRSALPAPDSSAATGLAYEAPCGDVEPGLAAIWQDLLGLERVGRHDDFFELGGHSLLAVKLISQVRLATGVELGLADLFAHPRLAELARAVSRAAASTLPPIEPIGRDGALPLSFAQQRLWFLAQMDGVSSAYHMPAALRLSGTLDRAALQASLDRIVERHEALRTTFVREGKQVVQRIGAPGGGLPIAFSDLAAEQASEQLEARLDQAAHQPFDLEQGPLVRAELFRLAEAEHVLLVTMHHIVSDGWSMGVLSRELGALYRAFLARQADPLPVPVLQYADYAAWQRRWLEGPVMQEQAAYWRRALADAPGLLTLPTDRPRPAQQDHAGSTVPLALGKPLSAALKSLGKREGTTLYMTLLAAWASVLSRLAGQDEVVIGSPVANRTHAGVEGLIGFFVNTLALRVDLSGHPSSSQLLQRVRQQTIDAQSNQDLPFEQVVELLKPERSLAHSPVFQAMFAWQGTDTVELDLGGVALQSIEPPQRTAMFDLSLDLEEVDGEIVGTLEYATALFDRATMLRYTAYLLRVLEGMVAAPGREISGIAILDEAERQQVLVDFNRSEAPWPAERTVHQLFEAVVAHRPEAIAVAHGQHEISYDALNRRANRIAHALIEIGVRPDQRVAISAERGIDTVAGLLGILKAGAAYVPLDPAYPAARIEHMLRDSAPVALLTQAALADKLPALDAPTLLLDDEAHFARFPEQDPVTEVAPGNLVYVIYTSGSTGLPKGVMVEHRNLVNYTVDAIRLFAITPEDVVLQQNSLNFDLSAEEIFPALLGGATLMPATQIFGAGASGSRPPSVVHLTAAHWHTLVAEWDRQPAKARELLDSVRLVNVTGDALSTQKLELWDRFRPEHTRLVNTYGPTETTVSCTAAYVGFDEARQRGMGIATIGKPLANTRIYLLDEHLQPVPQGVSGELHIGGDGVTRGYLNRDELTAQRFIRDPFSQRPGERLYKTGDLARWLPDGSLEYLGRNDFQVKIRGFRIELGEVEARLAECEGVREAAVIALTEADGAKRLVAYVVPQDGAQPSAAGLQGELSERLAGYMIPDAFVILAALPLTPNGKLDRQALPAPDAGIALAQDHEAPIGEVEEEIAQIWRELLGTERIGRHDSFFDLGGHSLLAVQLVIRLDEQFGVEVSLNALFEHPTLGQLADTVTSLLLVLYAADDLQDLELELGNLSESELLAQLKDAQSE